MENVWQFMRDNWLSNRIFKSYEDIVATVLPSLEHILRQTEPINGRSMSRNGMNSKWAHGF